MTAAEARARLDALGVHLRTVNGRLQWKPPRGIGASDRAEAAALVARYGAALVGEVVRFPTRT